MITAIDVVQQLCRQITTVAVVSKVPKDRPDVFVRVDQAAPVRTSPATDRALVIVQVYGLDRFEALGLCQRLREHLIDRASTHPKVFGWDEQSGPVEFPDPDLADEYRWQFTGTIYMASS